MKLSFCRKWTILAGLYTAMVAVILVLAYRSGIPSWIALVPGYDLIAHFVLYGIWGFVIHKALKRKALYRVPLGPALLTLITIFEELMQNFSMNRTFSLLDLFASLLGIWIVILIYELR